jgi:hypothetical protein
MKTTLAVIVLAASTAASDILVVDFKGTSKATTHQWVTNNDPVMGGRSYSTVAIENGLLNFTGSCKIVPSLKAPGFITVVNSDKGPWVDVSSCEGIKFNHKSANNYTGFRVSFGSKHAPGGGFFAYGFKANLGAPSVGKFGDAVLAFANFTDAWNDATGAPVHTCASNKIYCPDARTLADFRTMSIWAEGVEGDIQLEVNSISGYNCRQ